MAGKMADDVSSALEFFNRPGVISHKSSKDARPVHLRASARMGSSERLLSIFGSQALLEPSAAPVEAAAAATGTG